LWSDELFEVSTVAVSIGLVPEAVARAGSAGTSKTMRNNANVVMTAGDVFTLDTPASSDPGASSAGRSSSASEERRTGATRVGSKSVADALCVRSAVTVGAAGQELRAPCR
jgi:hypothetical protein